MKYKTNVWRPFRGSAYRYEMRRWNIIGVLKELFRDIRRCHERIWRGYCDYDIFSIDEWFLGLMPTMLEDFRDHLHGWPDAGTFSSQAVVLNDDDDNSSEGMQRWKKTLTKMIHLFREADEDTCTRSNPYQEGYDRAWDEFREKYGPFGEKLLTEEEKSCEWGRRAYTPSNVDEYKEICELYMAEEREMQKYRETCKDEAFELFSKWFYALWD